MPRQDFPTDIEAQTIVLAKIKKRVDFDGAGSVLEGMLTKNTIVLADDVAKGVTALAKNNSYLAFKQSSEISSQKRNNLMLPINGDMTSCYQFLKTHFSPDFKEITDWGGEITTGGKITYALTTLGQLNMLKALIAKNESFNAPAVSPLAPYLTLHKIDLALDATNAADALDFDTTFADDKKSSETAREQRDIEWATPLAHIHLIADYLMKFYKGNAKMLGKYGFTVVNTAKAEKTRDKSLSPGDSIFGLRAKIGSTVLNTGKLPLPIYKGKTITGTPTLLAPGNIFTVTKGNSLLSFNNPSQTTKATFSLVPKKAS